MTFVSDNEGVMGMLAFQVAPASDCSFNMLYKNLLCGI